MSVEEAWKEWKSSETGAACLDPALLAATVELDRHLNYRIRAAFVAGFKAGWIAKEEADDPDKIIETFDKMLGEAKEGANE